MWTHSLLHSYFVHLNKGCDMPRGQPWSHVILCVSKTELHGSLSRLSAVGCRGNRKVEKVEAHVNPAQPQQAVERS